MFSFTFQMLKKHKKTPIHAIFRTKYAIFADGNIEMYKMAHTD